MARTKLAQVRRTEKQQREILQRLEASGLSMREFCSREGVVLSSLQRWRSRCGRAPEPRFVELAPPPTTAPASQSSWAVELELPGGMRLRLRA